MKEIQMNDPLLQHVSGGKGGGEKKPNRKPPAPTPISNTPVTTMRVGEESGNGGGQNTITTMAIGEESSVGRDSFNVRAFGSF